MNKSYASKVNKSYATLENIEFDGIHEYRDSPDWADAYITYAEWADGTPLTDDEIDAIPSDVMYDYLMCHIY